MVIEAQAAHPLFHAAPATDKYPFPGLGQVDQLAIHRRPVIIKSCVWYRHAVNI